MLVIPLELSVKEKAVKMKGQRRGRQCKGQGEVSHLPKATFLGDGNSGSDSLPLSSFAGFLRDFSEVTQFGSITKTRVSLVSFSLWQMS